MTKMETPSYGGNPRTKEKPANMGGMRADCTTAHIPTDGTAGYATGCLLQVYDCSAGAAFYVNEGTKASCDFNPVLTFGAIGSTAAEIDHVADVSARLVSLTANLTVTPATHEGKTLVLNAAGGFTVQIPAATGSGATYNFVVGVVSTTGYVIDATTGGSVFAGSLPIFIDNSTVKGFLSASNITVTLNGTTTGGKSIGDWITIQDIKSGVWGVTGELSGSGAIATPFSGA